MRVTWGSPSLSHPDSVARVRRLGHRRGRQGQAGPQRRGEHLGPSRSGGAAAAHGAVRESVPFVEKDEVLSGYLAAVESRVSDGELLAAVEKRVGALSPRAV